MISYIYYTHARACAGTQHLYKQIIYKYAPAEQKRAKSTRVKMIKNSN